MVWSRARVTAFSAAAVVITIAMAACHQTPTDDRPLPDPSPVVALQVVPTALPTMTSDYRTGGSRVRVAGVPGLEPVNAALRKLVVDDQNDLVGVASHNPVYNPDNESGSYEIELDKSVVSASSAVVSVLLFVREAYPGSKHGLGWASGTFQVPSGTPLGMMDLFGEPQRALTAISTVVKQHLVTTDSCVRDALRDFGEIPEGGMAPTGDNYKHFAITPAGLVVGFDMGQVGPNSCGSLQTTVDWPQLRAYLSDRGAHLIADLR